MPCDSINTAEVDAGKMIPKMVFAALEALGLRPVHNRAGIYDFTGGEYNHQTQQWTFKGARMTGQNVDEYANAQVLKIKQEYSAQIVQAQAQKFGWQIRRNGLKFEVMKR